MLFLRHPLCQTHTQTKLYLRMPTRSRMKTASASRIPAAEQALPILAEPDCVDDHAGLEALPQVHRRGRVRHRRHEDLEVDEKSANGPAAVLPADAPGSSFTGDAPQFPTSGQTQWRARRTQHQNVDLDSFRRKDAAVTAGQTGLATGSRSATASEPAPLHVLAPETSPAPVPSRSQFPHCKMTIPLRRRTASSPESFAFPNGPRMSRPPLRAKMRRNRRRRSQFQPRCLQ